MDQSILLSSNDTLLLAIPMLLMVFLSAFRLDQIIARPKGSQSRRRPARGVSASGELLLCDPDGRPSGPGRRNRVQKDDKPASLPARVVDPSGTRNLEAKWNAGSPQGVR